MSFNDSAQTSRSPEKPEAELEQGEEEEEDEKEEEELEKLEAEVKQMAEKILEYRTTLPDQIKTTVASLLSSQRLVLPDFGSKLDPGPSREPNPALTTSSLCSSGRQDKSSIAALLTEEDQKTAEKVHLLKERSSSNVSAMPVVLRRMKDCISKIDKLDSFTGNIHPVFKKKRTS